MDDSNSPFEYQQPDEDASLPLYLLASKRQGVLLSASIRDKFPVNAEASRFSQPPPDESNVLLRMLSRFLRPGQQTQPASPRQPGITGQE